MKWRDLRVGDVLSKRECLRVLVDMTEDSRTWMYLETANVRTFVRSSSLQKAIEGTDLTDEETQFIPKSRMING